MTLAPVSDRLLASGRAALSALPQVLPLGQPVLLVTDATLVALGVVAPVVAAVEAAGCPVHLFTGVHSDPLESDVETGREAAMAADAAAVIAVGGGSVLDAAKIIAATADPALGALSQWRMMATPLPAAACLPCIALPTTAGTGSEATSTTILSTDHKAKVWYWGEALRPPHVVLDPTLSAGLPPTLTAATGLDALVHAVEAVTNSKASDASRDPGLRAVALVAAHLPTAVAHGGDLAARQGMLQAAYLAGEAIEAAGTALAHNIAHALASLGPIHHGLAVARAMDRTLNWVREGNQEAFTQCARAMGGEDFAERWSTLLATVGLDLALPVPLRALSAERLAAEMAAPQNAPMRQATARPVTEADLLPLAALVLSVDPLRG